MTQRLENDFLFFKSKIVFTKTFFGKAKTCAASKTRKSYSQILSAGQISTQCNTQRWANSQRCHNQKCFPRNNFPTPKTMNVVPGRTFCWGRNSWASGRCSTSWVPALAFPPSAQPAHIGKLDRMNWRIHETWKWQMVNACLNQEWNYPDPKFTKHQNVSDKPNCDWNPKR